MRLDMVKYAVTSYPKYWLEYSKYSVKKVGEKITKGSSKTVIKMKNIDLASTVKNKLDDLNRTTRDDLINAESEYGKLLFGAIPEGHRREFFNLNPTEWIWHEEWPNEQGMIQRRTIKYQITKTGVLKVQVGKPNTYLAGEELGNFREAATKYLEVVTSELYR